MKKRKKKKHLVRGNYTQSTKIRKEKKNELRKR